MMVERRVAVVSRALMMAAGEEETGVPPKVMWRTTADWVGKK